VLAACGRVDFDVVPVGAPCAMWSPFSTPVEVTELAGPIDDWGPSLSADGLSVYFYSFRPGGLGNMDIWMSTRASPSDAWTTPVDVPNVNSTLEDRVPWISRDGLTLGFGSGRAGGPGMIDLWWATRSDPASDFGAPQPIPNVNTTGNEVASFLSANGLRLYISRDSAAGLDLYVAERADLSSDFGTPVAITELESPNDERDLCLSEDELEVFIASNRAGSQGMDLYRATRPDLASPFSTPVRVDELDSPRDDTQPELSRDGTTIYYDYNALISGGGMARIHRATRTCLAAR
jgi:hypothetical protein